MATSETKELLAKCKAEAAPSCEQTRPGRVFTPSVDIFETEGELSLRADMPGVNAENLDIDIRENTLTLSGEIEPVEFEKEDELLKEYEIGKYFRQFSLSEKIDQEKIDAKLDNGVLRLVLPKVPKATPRKITVAAA